MAPRLDFGIVGARASRAMFLTVTAALLSSCAGPSGAVRSAIDPPAPAVSQKDAPVESTKLIGKVWRRVGKTRSDTGKLEPVPSALITTDPKTDKVTTDADGIFRIEHEVTQRQYRVLVEADYQKGRSAPIKAEANKTIANIVVILGDGETAWPPPAAYEALLPKLNKAPGPVRCCNQ